MLHPLIPHVTEELWEFIGKKGFLSLAKWPEYDETLLTPINDYKWNLLHDIIDSINHIILIIKKARIAEITLITAVQWKFNFYSQLMDIVAKAKEQKDIIKVLMTNDEFKSQAKFIIQTVNNLLKNLGKFIKAPINAKEELDFFIEISPILEKKYNCSIKIINEEKSKEPKAKQALPGRPAIIIK